jgi:hypothetical protein
MKRIAVLIVVAAAGVLSAQAGAATFKGSVVARDSARHSVAVATKSGAVRTVRVQRLAALGARVTVHATALRDGTFRASKVSASGHASKARLHGVVVRKAGSKAFLSAGGTVVCVKSGDRRLSPGRSVTMDVRIEHDGLHGVRVLGVGTATVIKVEGAIASLSPLKITIDRGATIQLTVPAALTLPTGLAVGDQVEAIVSFADGAYTLVTLQTDEHARGDDDNETEVKGTVTGLTATTITVDPRGDAAAVTFAIPSGFNLHGVQMGDRVEAKGETVNGTLTLTRLHVEDEDDDHGDHHGHGHDHHGHHGGGGGDDD